MQLHQATSEIWGAEPVSFSVDFAVTHTAEQIELFCTPAQHGYSVPGDSQGCLLLHSNGEIAARGVLAIWHEPSANCPGKSPHGERNGDGPEKVVS